MRSLKSFRIGLRRLAVTFGVISVLFLSSSAAIAQTHVDARGALGPYDWVGDFPGRWDTGRFIRFMWFWDPSSFTELVHEETATVTGNPDGEILRYKVEALADVVVTNPELVDPRGISGLLNGELFIADYGANRIVAYNPQTGAFRTVFDGPEMDGPVDVDCRDFESRSGFGYPACGGFEQPECIITTVCGVVSKNNGRILLMDGDGLLFGTQNQAGVEGICWLKDFSEPRLLVTIDDEIRYFNVTGGFTGDDYRFNPYLHHMLFSIGFDDARGLASPDNSITYVANYGTDEILLAPRSWGTSTWTTGEVIWDAADGIDRPIDVAFSNPKRNDLAGNNWSNSSYVYVLNESGSIIRFDSPDLRWDAVVVEGRDPSYRLVSDVPELESVRSLAFIDSHRGAYAVTSNTSTGEASLLSFPWNVGVRIDVSGAPADAYLGVGRETVSLNSFVRWMWADASSGQDITFSATREETLSIFLGRGRGAQAAGFDLQGTETLLPALSKPATAVTPGASGGVIDLEIVHPTGADELRVFAYTGCESPTFWGRDNYTTVCEEGCNPRDSRCNCTNIYRDPDEGAFEVLYPDLFDCFTQIDEIAAEPSGTTSLSLAEFPTIPGMEYCFVSMAVDTAQNRYSQPSDLDFLASCAVSPAGSSVGLICNDALTALASSDGDIIEMATGAPGNPTWYRYTVPGDPVEEHVITATVDSEIYSAGTSMVRAYFDACPSVSTEPEVVSEVKVGMVANGGDQIFFELTYFGRRSMVWHLEDLVSAPQSEQLRPTGLTATGGNGGPAEDGQITVCWEPVRQAALELTNYDFMHYQVARGPIGGPANTILMDGYQGHCYVDRIHGPNTSFEYEITAIYSLYGGSPLYQSLDDSAVIRSEPSQFVAGTTSAVDVLGSTPTLPPPTGLTVTFPDPNEPHLFLPGRGTQSMGARLWWDEARGPTRHRIVQTEIGSGETTEFVVHDQTHAADIRIDRLARLCFDVIAERDEDDGTITVSEPAGWSAAGDARYCINMCTDSMVDLIVSGVDTWDGSVIPTAASFVGPSRNYALTFGRNRGDGRGVYWFEPQPYSGPFYTASFGGVPAQACAYQGTDACDDLVFLGCSESNGYGVTRHDFFIPNADDQVFITWELRPDLFPHGSTDVDFLSSYWVDVEFGVGTSPPDSVRALTSSKRAPSIALDMDSMCASFVTIDFAISNWEPEAGSFVAIIADDNIATTVTELTARSQVPVNPLIALHQIEIAIYQNSREKLHSWYFYQETGEGTGDVNHDCKIDVLDAVIINLHILGLEYLAAALLPLADFNMDTNIDVLDLVAIIARILEELAG